MNADPVRYVWDSVNVGDKASFNIAITDDMIARFIAITGDDNRLHTDNVFAQGKGFPKKVAHGMLLTSLFSRLMGKYFLGDDNLYLSQNVQFRKPILSGDNVTVYGVVSEKSESTRMLTIKTMIIRQDGTPAVVGQAVVTYI